MELAGDGLDLVLSAADGSGLVVLYVIPWTWCRMMTCFHNYMEYVDSTNSLSQSVLHPKSM